MPEHILKLYSVFEASVVFEATVIQEVKMEQSVGEISIFLFKILDLLFKNMFSLRSSATLPWWGPPLGDPVRLNRKVALKYCDK